jgi:PTS system ascorbate-specific IIA component
MTGILLITHGSLGEALLANAAHVLGGMQPNAVAMNIQPGDRANDRLAEARSIVKAIDSGAGVLVLTDIFGATPANIAGCLLTSAQVEGLAGVSLPMLVKALAYRHLQLAELTARALEGGIQGQIRIKEDCCHAAQGGG